MKNFFKISISVFTLSLIFSLFFNFSNSALGQFFLDENTKEESTIQKQGKFATTTFESKDSLVKINEDKNNTTEVVDQLKQINQKMDILIKIWARK